MQPGGERILVGPAIRIRIPELLDGLMSSWMIDEFESLAAAQPWKYPLASNSPPTRNNQLSNLAEALTDLRTRNAGLCRTTRNYSDSPAALLNVATWWGV